MNIAIIADIHGNLPGLQLVLRDIDARGITSIICLGDLIDGGQHNDEVVALIRSLGITTTRGNHDLCHDMPLADEHQAWLAQLPDTVHLGDALYTHISPRAKCMPIRSSVEAWNVCEEVPFRRCFIGHLHYPALYGYAHTHACDAREHQVHAGVVQLDPQDRYIISVGAIGYPRNGGRFVRYGIYNADQQTVEFVALEGPLLPFGC